jgi:5-methyltetrahydropteroyltriglutamate--homocysteine methyltransferase
MPEDAGTWRHAAQPRHYRHAYQLEDYMATKIVDKLLPTTMVGSYPRPQWFKQQLLGRDIRVAFKEVQHEEAYTDAVATVIRDQEEAGLDIVTDGNMWYDDYVGVIGSFCWYLYERIDGFDAAKEEHPSTVGVAERNVTQEMLHDWGGVVNNGPVGNSRLRFADLYKIASKSANRPIKVSVGAGPINLAWHVFFKHYKDAKELSFALAPIFNKEMKDLVAAGAKYLQLEDLGAWLPLFTNNKDDYKWIREVVEQCCDGVDAKIGWHFCFGNAWGNDILSAGYPEGYQTVLPYFFGTAGVDEFVLDYANRNMAGIDFLKNLPANQGAQVGVLDIRTNAVESPQVVADRIRKVVKAVPADKVTLSTDCGMKPLARMIAKLKLHALAEGAAIVRKEVAGV